jgi:hypothetical protein
VLDPDGKVLGTGETHQHTPGIASNGSSYLVTWIDDDLGPLLVAKPVDASGDPTDPAFRLGDALEFDLTSGVTATADGFLGVWSNSELLEPDVLGQRTDGHARVGDQLTVSLAATTQENADLAFDGRQHLAVWTEGSDEVRAARIGADGRSLDPNGIEITTGTAYAPSVGFDGTDYLVAWLDGRGSSDGANVFVARVSTSGQVLDPDGIQVTSSGGIEARPDVAAVGGRFVVVWTRGESQTGQKGEVAGARIDGAGHVVERLHIGESFDFDLGPSVAASRGQALVVWTSGYELRGRRITASDVLDPPTGIDLTDLPGYELQATVAASSSQYLVAWTYGGLRSSSFDLYATRVTRDGRVLDPDGIAVSTTAGEQEQPSVAANGSFLVAWRDANQTRRADIAVTTISGSGTVARPGGQIVTHSPQQDGSPALAPGAAPGAYRLAWQLYVPEPPYGNVRVFTRIVAP